MKNKYKYTILLLLWIAFCGNTKLMGQIAISSASTVTENFTIGASSTASLPSNWKMSAAGITANYNTGSNLTATIAQASSGTPTTGSVYNWGNGTTTTDRAIGFMTSGSYASPNSILAFYRNTSGFQINDIIITFDVERYRINTNLASITFFTSTDGTTWTSRTSGDIASGVFATGSSSYTFSGGSVVNRTVSITGINIPNSGDFYLRWVFNTIGANSQGLGLDNVGVTATLSATPNISISSPSQITDNSVFQGLSNRVISAFEIGVTTAATNLTGLTITTAGTYAATDLSNLKVWYQTGATFNAGTATLLSTKTTGLGAGSQVFPSFTAQSIPIGTGYIFVTANIASAAVVNNTISVNAIANTDISFSAGSKSGSATAGGIQTIIQPPTITPSPTSLTGLTYVLGTGPSSASTFTLSAGSLTAGGGTITINASTNYEVSVTSATTGFSATSVTIPYTGTGTIASNTVYVRLKAGLSVANYNGETLNISGGGATSSVTISGNVTNPPTITPSPTTLTGLTYAQGFGPSTASSFTLSANNLTAGGGNIIISASSHYEVSATSATTGFSPVSVSISYTGTGTLSSNTIYVRLKAGLSTANYNSEILNIAGGGATNSVTVSGSVTVSPTTTVLYPGDIAMVAFNANDFSCSGDDSDFITFICFKDILTGTVLDITDNGWQRANANQWGDSEGVLRCTYTAAATIVAGTKITFRLPTSGTPTVTGWSFSEIGGGATLNMNGSGDQLYFMQGGTWNNPTGSHNATYAGGRILFAFNSLNVWSDFANTTSDSGLYPNTRCFSASISAGNYVRYTGTTTITTQRNWINRINGIANWTTYTDCSAYNAATSPNFSITTGTITAGKWLGSNSTNWFDCSNWESLAVPDPTIDVTIDATASNNPTISATATYATDFGSIAQCNNIDINRLSLILRSNTNNRLDVYGNLTISGTGILDMDDSNNATVDGTINLYGNWINNLSTANFLEGNGKINGVGVATQTIFTNTSPETFYNLNGSNSSNVKLLSHINVSNQLSVSLGMIDLNGFNANLGTTGTLVENRASSLVVTDNTATYYNDIKGGYVGASLRTLNGTAGTDIAGLGIELTNGITGTVGIERYHCKVVGTPTSSIRKVFYIAPSVAVSSATMKIYYSPRDLVGVGFSDGSASFRLYRGQSPWTMQASPAAVGSCHNTVAKTVFADNIAGFSPWTAAPELVILPVTMTYFKAKKQNNSTVELTWQTIGEENHKGFEIQKSTDGSNFQSIGFVQNLDKQNLTTSKNYVFLDIQYLQTSYYRLKQIDIDGKITYSRLEVVVQTNTDNPTQLFQILPNPSTNKVALHTNLSKNANVYLYLTDMLGVELLQWEGNIENIESKLCKAIADLPTGMYILSVWNENNKMVQKIVKE